MSYEAFVLSDTTRQMLLSGFDPKYPEVLAHHITYRFGVPRDPTAKYGDVVYAQLVGYADGDGIEAFVVEIEGTSRRPDGKTYHLTFSLDRERGRKPVDSNGLIAEGWTRLRMGPTITVTFQYVE